MDKTPEIGTTKVGSDGLVQRWTGRQWEPVWQDMGQLLDRWVQR